MVQSTSFEAYTSERGAHTTNVQPRFGIWSGLPRPND